VRKLIPSGSSGRRAVGLAAAAVVVGGAAATWLASSAHATTPGPMLLATTTAVTGTTQLTSEKSGAVLKVGVSVTAGGGSKAPTGDVVVSAGSDNCTASVHGANGGTVSTGSCDIYGLSTGTVSVTAAYKGAGDWSASSTASGTSVTLNGAPAITSGAPPTTTSVGASYTFTFTASGTPAATFTLDGPKWLTINSTSGAVSGTVPSGIKSFKYSVTATNSAGTATGGPYKVTVSQNASATDVVASLSCSKSVNINGSGKCSLTVENDGSATAYAVTAQVKLPSQLRADCGQTEGWFGNGGTCKGTVSWKISSLAAGASKVEKLTFTANQGGYSSSYGKTHSTDKVTVKGSATTDAQSASISSTTVTIHAKKRSSGSGSGSGGGIGWLW
jgi:hypothetical protein